MAGNCFSFTGFGARDTLGRSVSHKFAFDVVVVVVAIYDEQSAPHMYENACVSNGRGTGASCRVCECAVARCSSARVIWSKVDV